MNPGISKFRDYAENALVYAPLAVAMQKHDEFMHEIMQEIHP